MKYTIRWKIFPAGVSLLLSLMSPAGFAAPTPPEAPIREEIRDIKGPFPLAQLIPWLLPLAAAVSLGAGMWLFMIIRRERSRSSLLQDLSPLSSETALDTLAVRFSGGQEEIHHLYEELSSLVRLFLEQRTGLPARRMTSEEILRETTIREAFFPKEEEQFRLFLLRCDLVKFAGGTPTATEMQEDLAAARVIIKKKTQNIFHRDEQDIPVN